MKSSHVNTKDTTHDELVRLAKKCGFVVLTSGRKHDKVKTLDGKTITIIPKHNKIKRETAKGIIEAMIVFGANISFN